MIEKNACTHRIGQSCFYEAFGAGILTPAKLVRIGWNTNDAGQVTEILVSADKEEWSRRCRDLEMSGGACYADWCVPPGERTGEPYGPDQIFDPAGTFGTLLSCGFASKRALRDALIQFAKIEEATWARRMLFAIEGEWTDDDIA